MPRETKINVDNVINVNFDPMSYEVSSGNVYNNLCIVKKSLKTVWCRQFRKEVLEAIDGMQLRASETAGHWINTACQTYCCKFVSIVHTLNVIDTVNQLLSFSKYIQSICYHGSHCNIYVSHLCGD